MNTVMPVYALIFVVKIVMCEVQNNISLLLHVC